jgi:hypothetical protein
MTRRLLKGTADVKMGDVPWLKFSYNLEKKRSRYSVAVAG